MKGFSLSVIVAEGLTKSYGRRVGVSGLDLAIGEGELFGFLGPNGAGKTTAIRVLMGLLRSTGGRATIFGRDCWSESHHIHADVGYLPGDFRAYPWLTCRKALRLFGHARRRDFSSAGFEVAEKLGLDPDLAVHRMSRGTRQKLGLVMALAHRPKLLLLDEPTSALDPVVQETLCTELRRMADAGHTVFFSSHTLSEVERLCDRVSILRAGSLIVTERLADLRARARRVITICWRERQGDEVAVPPCLEIFERQERLWQARLNGNVPDFLAWCSGKAIDDLTIEKPDLNQVFQQYYGANELS